jgi:hypothetical protein
MIYCEKKLTDWTDALVTNADTDTALRNAVLWGRLNVSVEEAEKVIRIQAFSLQYLDTMEEKEAERDVEFEIQFLVKPVDNSLYEFQIARNLSYEMYKQWITAINADSDLGGTVCNISHDDKAYIDVANLEAVDYGATYAYGRVNPN